MAAASFFVPLSPLFPFVPLVALSHPTPIIQALTIDRLKGYKSIEARYFQTKGVFGVMVQSPICKLSL